MGFKSAVQQTESTRGAYCVGLQALRGPDRARVSVDDPQRLRGSIDLDLTLKAVAPNAARWDYGIAYKKETNDPEFVFWVEVHPATGTGNLDEISRKIRWLKDWLTNDGWRIGGLRRQFIWIASGRSAFTATSPQLRALAEQGLRFCGRHLRITRER